MILFNITYSVDANLHRQWLDWVTTTFIPEIMRSEKIVQSRICRILAEEAGGISYSLQLISHSENNYQQFLKEYLPAAENRMAKKFPDAYVSFSTALQILHQHDL